jgi:2-oxoglutarate dehydrogenase E1 component
MATPEGPLNGANLAFVESLFAAYLSDPSSVSADWQAYFAALEPAPNGAFGPLRSTPGLFERRAPSGPPTAPARATDARSDARSDVAAQQDKVDQLVRAYRVRGHMVAKVDPLELPRAHQKELDPEFYGLGAADLERKFSARTITSAGR